MRFSHWLSAVVFGLAVVPVASAQSASDGPITKDTSVGYIDSAVPLSQLRLRYDSAYDYNRPTRAEYFYAKYRRGGGAGMPLPELSVDAQEISVYGEAAIFPTFSLFVEAPTRFVNPVFNENHAGLSDINAGFKFAFWEGDQGLATLFFRTIAPTGNSHAGLGTGHVSFEQGVLFNHRLSELVLFEGETRVWVPVGGSDFQGTIVRYGGGLSLGRRSAEGFWATPVVECVGWTVLSGRDQETFSLTVHFPTSAVGDTIVNGKAGVRFGVGEHFDMYAGYGRALTGEVWYKDVLRLEARWKF